MPFIKMNNCSSRHDELNIPVRITTESHKYHIRPDQPTHTELNKPRYNMIVTSISHKKRVVRKEKRKKKKKKNTKQSKPADQFPYFYLPWLDRRLPPFFPLAGLFSGLAKLTRFSSLFPVSGTIGEEMISSFFVLPRRRDLDRGPV